MKLFEILIPTVTDRAHLLTPLLDELQRQIHDLANGPDLVGIRIDEDQRQVSIGEKRQRLIHACEGEYCAFVDDDDRVSPDYVATILQALGTMPDVVGITMHVSMDGRPYDPSPIFRHSLRFRDNKHWEGHDRTPHHLCPTRTELARLSRFPAKSWGEDYDYAIGLLPHLETEAWAGDSPIYFYDYKSQK